MIQFIVGMCVGAIIGFIGDEFATALTSAGKHNDPPEDEGR